MVVRKINDAVYFLGSIHWDRRLFDGLIPLPEGTSYNAFLVKGSEGTVLIDTTDPALEDVLLEDLKELGIEHIDYLVSHHAEQDHSGTIPRIIREYGGKVVTNAKNKGFLTELLSVRGEDFHVMEDGETLNLGDITLEFIKAPWVHWPETMLTYLKEHRLLFTCDLFGSHYATSEVFCGDPCHVYSGAKRYYAEIMMPFRRIIRNHLRKVGKLDIDIIAPSHGPLYNRPEFILDAYEEWTSDEVKNEVILAYVSMHGSTEKMANPLIDGLIKKGIEVKVFDLVKTDIGELAMALVDAATLVLGTPTVHTGPHPAAVYAAYLANALRPKAKFASVFGSYLWANRTVDVVKDLLSNLKVEFIEPVYIKGRPGAEDLKSVGELADAIYGKHKEAGIIDE